MFRSQAVACSTGRKRSSPEPPEESSTSTAGLSYGGDTAKARARFEINDCTPNCAEGKTSYVNAVVTLSPVVPCRGTPIYERLTVTSSEDESLVSAGQSSVTARQNLRRPNAWLAGPVSECFD
jgi:hypothetical protein